jgi:benzoyl-CoA reductase/2-hydroxyglutaryl-CoA dehydratase subunit BcrC/BadD/HgdB
VHPDFAPLARVCRGRTVYAEQWAKSGRKVVGCFGSDIPEELLIAGGFLPVRIFGDPAADTSVGDRYLEIGANSMVRAQFSSIVGGTFFRLDRLVVSASTDAHTRLFHYLRMIRATEPHMPVPELYFFDFLHSRTRNSALYNRDRMMEFWRAVEGWAGRALSRDDVAGAVSVCNENRRLLRELDRLRTDREAGPRVSGTEAMQAAVSSLYMPKEEHSRLLQAFLDSARNRAPLQGLRVYIAGSPHDHSGFYELAESCGAVIVGENHEFGARLYAGDVDLETEDLIDALVDRYHLRPASTTQTGVREQVEHLVAEVKRTGAEAVVFHILDGDDAPSWDYPEQRRALKELGVPALLMDRQPFGFERQDEQRARLAEFFRQARERNNSGEGGQ